MKFANVLLLTVLAAALPASGAAIYDITIATNSLAPGTTGFIDFGFNGGFPATATIDNFLATGGSLDAGTITTFGTVTGTLPGEVILANDNADYDEGINFGSSVSFRLTLAGTPGGAIGDVFTLSFFNSTFSGGVLTGNVNDFWIAQFQWDTHGNITPTAFANPAGGPSFASIAAVPEPAGISTLLGLAGACMFAIRRRAIKN